MAVGCETPAMGYNSALAVAKETAFGTFVTATSFLEFDSESFKFMREEQKIESINSTRDFKKRVIGSETVEGAIEAPLNVAADACINIIKQALGGTVSSSVLSTTSYKHIMNVGDMENNASTGTDDMKSLSIAVRKGDTHTWDFSGMRVNNLTIKGEVGGLVTFNAEMIGRYASLTSTIPAVSYSDVLPVNFTGLQLLTGATISAASTEEFFTAFELTVNNNLDGDQRSLGSRNICVLPPVRREVKLKLTQRFDTTTAYTRALENTSTAMKIICDTETVIEDGTTYSMAILLPSVYFNPVPMPEVGDMGVLSIELDGSCMYNSSTANVMQVEVNNATASYL